MKDIDDRMVIKALRNLQRARRCKPFVVLCGVFEVVTGVIVAGLTLKLADAYIYSPGSPGRMCMFLSAYVFVSGFYICMGVFMIATGLVRNSKDIILEHLAKHYFEDQKPDVDSG